MQKKIIEKLFISKGLEADMLENPIQLSDPIENHAAWVYRNILSKPYFDDINEILTDFPRPFHGMTHACRTAIYIPILANIYTMISPDHYLFSQEKIKKLMICLLFHDVARLHDGEDEWDQESALFCYLYLKKLGVPLAECRQFAEAMANRDLTDVQYTLIDTEDELYWQSIFPVDTEISPEEVIIQAADCYDIKRVRAVFDIKFLQLYQLYGQNNPWVFKLLTHLALEFRCFIDLHGESYMDKNNNQKKHYECENGFVSSLKLLQHPSLFLLSTFYNNACPIPLEKLKAFDFPEKWRVPYDPARGMDEDNIEAALREGKIFARGFLLPPSALDNKPQTVGDRIYYRSFAKVENYKAGRKPGVPTSSSKPDYLQKNKNPARSVVPLSPGTVPAAALGYLIVNPDMENIQSISQTNALTGYGKKSKFFARNIVLTKQEILEKYQKVLKTQQMGGVARQSNHSYPFLHPEITYNIDTFHGIYICTDPMAFNKHYTNSYKVKKLPLLVQAIYLRIEHEKMYGISLPIFEYSAKHFFIKKIPETKLTEEKIIEYWTLSVLDYYRKIWRKVWEFPMQENMLEMMASILKKSLNTIKIEAIYNPLIPYELNYQSADENYSPLLQDKLDKTLSLKIREYLCSLKHNHNICQDIDLLRESARDNVKFFISNEHLYSPIDPTNSLTNWLNYVSFRHALSIIAINNSHKVMDYILHRTKKVNWNNTLLMHFAVKNNSYEVISLLIKNGVNINLNDPVYRKPYLIMALCNQHYEMSRFLLEAGAEPNHPQAPALEYLSYVTDIKLQKKCFHLLLKYQACPFLIRQHQPNFYQKMIWEKHNECILQHMVDNKLHLKPHDIDTHLYINLFPSDKFPEIDILKMHLTQQTTCSISFLEFAILVNNPEAVSTFITQDNRDIENMFGYKPIELARALNHKAIINLLEQSELSLDSNHFVLQ